MTTALKRHVTPYDAIASFILQSRRSGLVSFHFLCTKNTSKTAKDGTGYALTVFSGSWDRRLPAG